MLLINSSLKSFDSHLSLPKTRHWDITVVLEFQGLLYSHWQRQQSADCWLWLYVSTIKNPPVGTFRCHLSTIPKDSNLIRRGAAMASICLARSAADQHYPEAIQMQLTDLHTTTAERGMLLLACTLATCNLLQ
jgi:hypothetical protein